MAIETHIFRGQLGGRKKGGGWLFAFTKKTTYQFNKSQFSVVLEVKRGATGFNLNGQMAFFGKVGHFTKKDFLKKLWKEGSKKEKTGGPASQFNPIGPPLSPQGWLL